MSKLSAVVAAVVLVMGSTAWAVWSEDFGPRATALDFGSGQQAAYVSGTDFDIPLGSVLPGDYGQWDTDLGGFIKPGYTNWSMSQVIGPGGAGSGNEAFVVHQTMDGAGTYYAKAKMYRMDWKFGYQDINNYFRLWVCGARQYVTNPVGNPYSFSSGQYDSVLYSVENGTKWPIAGGKFASAYSMGYDDQQEVTIDWDPVANTIDITVVETDNGTGGDNSVYTLTYSATDPNNWETGKFGGGGQSYTSPSRIDELSYVPEPTTLALLGLGVAGAILRRRR